MKENQNIEWKQSWRDEYLKWICGFANAEGGTLEHAGVTFPLAHSSLKTPAETPVETLVKTLVETPMAILACLGANPSMTLNEVAAQIGRSVSAVERASAKLVTEGKLRYVGPQKGGHWEVLEVLK